MDDLSVSESIIAGAFLVCVWISLFSPSMSGVESRLREIVDVLRQIERKM